MRKVTANRVSNNWDGLLEVLEIKLVTRIPGQMSRCFGCSIVKVSQNLRRRWIEGSYVHEATSQVRNFYLICVAILHLVISTRDVVLKEANCLWILVQARDRMNADSTLLWRILRRSAFHWHGVWRVVQTLGRCSCGEDRRHLTWLEKCS